MPILGRPSSRRSTVSLHKPAKWTTSRFCAFRDRHVMCPGSWLGPQPRDVVGADTHAKALGAEALQPIRQRLQILCKVSIIGGPGARMLFRPEEIHPSSPPGPILWRPTYLAVGIAHHSLRTYGECLFIAHLHDETCSTVETWGIHPYHLARKQPAYRQRLEASLREPLLLAVNADVILRW
jgi:hypothetical protein